MNEQDFARSVRRRLDAGLDTLTPAVLHRLREAREAAIARARERPALQDASVQWPGRAWRLLAPVAALLLIVGVLSWQQHAQYGRPGQPADYADVDTEVLTDDLPVVAYLDPGFEIWLYHHSPASVED
jgi:uncharacterized protein DUF3619